MTQFAGDNGEWAGAPMIHDTIPLIIEPRYPYQGLNGAAFNKREVSQETLDDLSQRADFSNGSIYPINTFYSKVKNSVVWLYHNGNGRTKFFVEPSNDVDRRLDMILNTLGASQCWSLESELRACETLRELVTPVAYEYYMLTGTFLETSQRSRVTYLFRKLRPTIALSNWSESQVRALAALCMHPIGYYDKTWAGAMCPTDDVIAHLLFMRADERKFWSKCNHHPLDNYSAGV